MVLLPDAADAFPDSREMRNIDRSQRSNETADADKVAAQDLWPRSCRHNVAAAGRPLW